MIVYKGGHVTYPLQPFFFPFNNGLGIFGVFEAKYDLILRIENHKKNHLLPTSDFLLTNHEWVINKNSSNLWSRSFINHIYETLWRLRGHEVSTKLGGNIFLDFQNTKFRDKGGEPSFETKIYLNNIK